MGVTNCCSLLSMLSLTLWTPLSGTSDAMLKHHKIISAVKNISNIESSDVWKAMESVDRSYFLNKDYMQHNYSAQPVHVGYGYYCETPYLASQILSLMEPYLKSPGSNILEIGTGSGYLTVCMNEMLHAKSTIISLEINLKLLNRTIKTVQNYYKDVLRKELDKQRTALMWWNGKRGMYSRSPFDVIYFSGLVSDNEYNKLMYQIKPQGILIGYDWNVDNNGKRSLWLKKWHKPTDLDVQCLNVVKCKHFYRELMKNKALLKLNDLMGDIVETVRLNKHGKIWQRDE